MVSAMSRWDIEIGEIGRAKNGLSFWTPVVLRQKE
jgi:hypothetical protein